MKPILIAPSIVSSDHLRLQEEITACEDGGADWIHVDVMDGHFVPNITMGPFLVQAYKRATRLPLDVHLMIERPERYLDAYAKAGAARLTVHIETCPHVFRILQEIKDLGCEAGVTLNPGTPIRALEAVLAHVNLVLVMSVNPGFSFQSFLPDTIGRVREVRRMLDELKSPAHLEVDGGVSPDNIARLVEAGANAFVSANYVFRHPEGAAAGVQSLRQAASDPVRAKSRPV
jgi:ribulose-phosphate 3-epimerase